MGGGGVGGFWSNFVVAEGSYGTEGLDAPISGLFASVFVVPAEAELIFFSTLLSSLFETGRREKKCGVACRPTLGARSALWRASHSFEKKGEK